MTQLIIVEDSRVSREAFEQELALLPDVELVASIENAANAELLCLNKKVDLVLMDVCTADDESGLDAAARIKRSDPDIKIIGMTSMPEHSFLEKAKAAGCDSFWYKETDSVSLGEICRRTLAGERVWPEGTPVVKIGLCRSDELTRRELDVIRLMAQGHRYEEITGILHISINTVKYHVKNLLQKTGYRSTVQLVAEVVEKRVVLPKY